MEYYLFVSNECNLNCKYCSVMIDAKKHKIPISPQYSIENLNGFIRSLQTEHKDIDVDIVLFGGEPTLNYDFIDNLISKQNKDLHDFNVRYMLHTNGILLKNISDKILLRLNSIMISINSLEVPVFNLNGSYFDTIISSIRSVKRKHSIPIIGRLTITENSSLYTTVMQFHHFFDYIHWQIENCYSFLDFNSFYESYTYDLQLLINIWESYLSRGIILKLIPFLSCAFYFYDKPKYHSFLCGYNQSMIYIQTDGICYSCAEDFLSKKNIIGDIMKGIKFLKFSLKDTKCNECEYVNMCYGRCGRMHYEYSEVHINEYCKLNAKMFEYFKNNRIKIKDICNKNKISIEKLSFVTNYTEYIP